MKRPLEKDFYSIVGVAPDATAEEIRQAYLARTRIIHPDRFDRERQPQDWKKANEMLAELNEAYSILRNATSRAQHDEHRVGKHSPPPPPPNRQPHTSEPPPPFELGELAPGQAAFGNLPKNVQDRLLKRQHNKAEDQFQIKLASVGWNYVFIGLLLCWWWYLFADADGAKWKTDTVMSYAGITLAAACLIGRNLITIRRWSQAKLKPHFYVTPIYFLKTEFDIVSFRPIWELKDVAVTHNYKNGVYQNSDVVLKFDGHNQSVCLSSKQQVETMLGLMRTYDARLRTAYTNRDHAYFRNNDDFYRVPRSGVPLVALLSRSEQAAIYGVSLLVCSVGLFAATIANEKLSRERWVRHPTPIDLTPSPQYAPPTYHHGGTPTYFNLTPPPTFQPVVTPSYPEQPMPASGSVQAYTKLDRVAPFEIRAAQSGHYLLKLVDAYTYAPILTVFVRSGTTVNVDVPLGTYEVRYASGEAWYGYEYLFGPETAYSKADQTFTFDLVGNRVGGFTITLYKVANGNLHTSQIKPTEF